MAQMWTGCTTSIAKVQQQQYNTTSLHGLKRSLDQTSSVSYNGSVLGDVTNISSAQEFAKRRRINNCGESRLIASKICRVGSTSEGSADRISTEPKVPLMPGPSQNPLLSLAHPKYGLPEILVKNFASLGINSIYPWQSSCLLGRGLLDGSRNLVYTAPTGGGKSLIADVLMLKRVIEDTAKKAILVLPYMALIQEKLKWLRRACEGVQKILETVSQQGSEPPMWRRPHSKSVRVVGFFGGSKARGVWSDVDIAVCTIEKANSLVNTAIEDCTINNLGVVVLDELHMIDDDYRGYLMEVMAKILAKWLNAKYYNTKYVPVPIEEHLVYDNFICSISTSSAFSKTASQLNSTQPLSSVLPTRHIESSSHKELKNPVTNAVVSLAVETASTGYGALVFCSGRQRCQSTALLISEATPISTAMETRKLDRRKDVISELRSLSIDLDETLGKTIIRGVAFHHAGLTAEEREIIAEAYDKGIINVIVATGSLAAGINLPARRVILQGARMRRDMIGPAMLRQMRGRAGRKGKDEVGESYLCCQKADLEEVAHLLGAELPRVESSLTPEKRGIKRALLEVITVRLATHVAAINDYVQRTLLYYTMDRAHLNAMVAMTLDELIAFGLITLDGVGSYKATLLSQAILAAHLTPDDGLFLHDELCRALRAFVMDGDMHIFYTFTPLYNAGPTDINWSIFRREMESLDESSFRVLEFVGVNPGLINRMANSAKPLPETSPEEIRTARLYRRFYAALQLRDLCNETPVHVVARKYGVSRGFVQTVAQICEGFAAGMISFCDRMGWGMLKVALEHMSDRLKAGARADLLELAKVPFVKSRTARVLWENGLKGLRAVAEVDARELMPILLLAQPKKSRLDDEAEAKYRQKLLLKAEIIITAANRLWEQQQQVEIEMDM